MMQDGFYTVSFETRFDRGGGVAVVEGDRLTGGDSLMYWTGTVSRSGEKVELDVQVIRHGDHGVSVLGDHDRFRLKAKGRAEGDVVTVSGQADVAPQMTLTATLRRTPV